MVLLISTRRRRFWHIFDLGLCGALHVRIRRHVFSTQALTLHLGVQSLRRRLYIDSGSLSPWRIPYDKRRMTRNL